MKDIARELVRVARDIVADDRINKIVQIFDSMESRWQDESEYEDFREYQKVAKKAVEKQGFRFVSLKERPMKLKFKDADKEYTVRVKGSQIVVEER
jgi:hypothetical protein